MAGLSDLPCVSGNGPFPVAADCERECGCGGSCHCVAYDPCDEECDHELCARWSEWFNSLPIELRHEIFRVYWIEPTRATVLDVLIQVLGEEQHLPQ